MHRAYDVSRPAPYFYIDAPDVLADKSECEKYHPGEKKLDCRQCPQCAFFLRAEDQPMRNDCHRNGYREHGNSQSNHAQYLNWTERKSSTQVATELCQSTHIVL